MKKQLVAIAVAAAVAAPAMAQNVAITGNFGIGVVQTDKDGTTADTTSIKDAATQSSTANSDRRSSSQINITASEDLGGGMKASVVLEMGLQASTGAMTTAGTFDRKSYIEVSSAKFGTVRAGLLYTATEQAEGYSAMGWNLFDSDTNEVSGGKLANSVQYVSPELIKGLTILANTTSGEGARDAHQYGYGANYVSGNLTLGIATDVQNITDTAETSNETSTFYNAGYNFGVAEARVTHGRYKNEDSQTAKYTRYGVAVPLAGGVKVAGIVDKYTGNATVTKFSGYGVAVEKALSKRTTLWAGFRSKDVDGGSTSDYDVTTFGIDHKF
jgi:predicted porin